MDQPALTPREALDLLRVQGGHAFLHPAIVRDVCRTFNMPQPGLADIMEYAGTKDARFLRGLPTEGYPCASLCCDVAELFRRAYPDKAALYEWRAIPREQPNTRAMVALSFLYSVLEQHGL